MADDKTSNQSAARVQPANQDPSIDDVINLLKAEQTEWLETTERHRGALIGERWIVLDAFGRAYSTISLDGVAHSKLELPEPTLIGVMMMSERSAGRVMGALSEELPDAMPFKVWDFAQYAEHKAQELGGVIKAALETKWRLGRESKTMDDGKELAGLVLARQGLSASEWVPSQSAPNWSYADVRVGVDGKVRLGVSDGGVVQVNGDPFTPFGDKPGEGRQLHVTLIAVEESLKAAVEAILALQAREQAAAVHEAKVEPQSERLDAYSFPPGYRQEAEIMYRRLRGAGFSPDWKFGDDHSASITLPAREMAGLTELQRSNPATWGNAPDVKAALDANRIETEALQAEVAERTAALSAEQREWVEVLHYETGLDARSCLELNDRLVDLTAKHLKLCNMGLHPGLSGPQELARTHIESQVREVLDGLKGVQGAKFLYDPRGTTVGIVFENQARNSSLASMCRVPVPAGAVSSLQGDWWHEHVPDVDGYLVLSIENTSNAAFVDMGPEVEIGRIVGAAAEELLKRGSVPDSDGFRLRDVNGNKVGEAAFSAAAPAGEVASGTVRLSVRVAGSGLDGEIVDGLASTLREAARKIEDGERVFALRDGNGNLVGKFEFREEPSLEKSGVIDMDEALNSGRVYLADDGFSGIADGEYRYVVTTSGFEPGYGQGEGDVWLVNAKGEIASGYEEPQSVREVLFRELNHDEKSDLRAVVEGRVPFEEFERRLSGEEPKLG